MGSVATTEIRSDGAAPRSVAAPEGLTRSSSSELDRIVDAQMPLPHADVK
jgi:hypothetical protein